MLHIKCILMLYIGLHCQRIDACGKRPGFKPIDLPSVRNTTAPVTTVHKSNNSIIPVTTLSSTTQTTTRDPFGRQPCTAEEKKETRCLNGGRCYALPFTQEWRHLACECLKNFDGLRCERLGTIPTKDKDWKMHMAIGLTISLLLAVIVIALGIWLYRRDKRIRRQRKTAKQDPSNLNINNSEEGKSLTRGNIYTDELNGNNVTDHLYEVPFAEDPV